MLLMGSESGVSGLEDPVEATDLELGDEGLTAFLLGSFLSGICLTGTSLLNLLTDLSAGFGSSLVRVGFTALRTDGGLRFVFGVSGREEEEPTEAEPGDWGLALGSSFLLKNLPGCSGLTDASVLDSLRNLGVPPNLGVVIGVTSRLGGDSGYVSGVSGREDDADRSEDDREGELGGFELVFVSVFSENLEVLRGEMMGSSLWTIMFGFICPTSISSD